MLAMDARSFSHLVLNLHALQISMFQPDRVSQDFPRNVIYNQCSLPPIYLKKQTNKEPRFIFFSGVLSLQIENEQSLHLTLARCS